MSPQFRTFLSSLRADLRNIAIQTGMTPRREKLQRHHHIAPVKQRRAQPLREKRIVEHVSWARTFLHRGDRHSFHLVGQQRLNLASEKITHRRHCALRTAVINQNNFRPNQPFGYDLPSNCVGECLRDAIVGF